MPSHRPPKPDNVQSVIRKRDGGLKTMSEPPEPLKALSRLIDRIPTLDENADLETEINIDTNDRGSALIIGSNVEKFLQNEPD